MSDFGGQTALLRFALAGLVNAGFGYGVFALLVLIGLWPGVALAAATVAGVAFNFQTSRRYVFRTGGHVFRFLAVYTAILALNWTALSLLRRCGLPELGGQALLTLPIAGLSFLGQQTFVFVPSAEPA